MLFSFLVSVAAGFATPYAEPHVEKLLKGVLLDDVPMKEGEFRIFTFVLLLLLATVILTLGGAGGSAFLVVLGGGLGLFGTRFIDIAKKKMADSKKDKSAKEAVEEAVEKAEDAAE